MTDESQKPQTDERQQSSGAQQDLKRATDLVRKMVAEWGMSGRLGAAAFPRGDSQRSSKR